MVAVWAWGEVPRAPQQTGGRAPGFEHINLCVCCSAWEFAIALINFCVVPHGSSRSRIRAQRVYACASTTPLPNSFLIHAPASLRQARVELRLREVLRFDPLQGENAGEGGTTGATLLETLIQFDLSFSHSPARSLRDHTRRVRTYHHRGGLAPPNHPAPR